MAAPADVVGPQALHPASYGAYGWYSSVHGFWMLARLLRRSPVLPEAAAIRAALGANLTAENLRAQADDFARKASRPFEQPYGWAWLLQLAEELHGRDDPDAKVWSTNLRPLAEAVAARDLEFFPKQTYPIRTGVHPNTAFWPAFANDLARAVGDARLEGLVEARAYFGADADAPARWEPSVVDYYLPCLVEADLMRRVLAPAEFRAWFVGFLPRDGPGGARVAMYARHGGLPDGPASGAPGRAEPEPGMVPAGRRSGPAGRRPGRAVLIASADRHADAAWGAWPAGTTRALTGRPRSPSTHSRPRRRTAPGSDMAVVPPSPPGLPDPGDSFAGVLRSPGARESPGRRGLGPSGAPGVGEVGRGQAAAARAQARLRSRCRTPGQC